MDTTVVWHRIQLSIQPRLTDLNSGIQRHALAPPDLNRGGQDPAGGGECDGTSVAALHQHLDEAAVTDVDLTVGVILQHQHRLGGPTCLQHIAYTSVKHHN